MAFLPADAFSAFARAALREADALAAAVAEGRRRSAEVVWSGRAATAFADHVAAVSGAAAAEVRRLESLGHALARLSRELP